MSSEEYIWNQLERSFVSGRLAHAWMIVGDPLTHAREMALRMATMVMSEGQNEEGVTRTRTLVDSEHHPDLISIEPHSKSRRIRTDEIRTLNGRIYQTSFEGGWKVAMIYHADRLMDNAANAFLKTLEEPPDRTLILLLTQSPHSVLTTIISRCQRIILSEELAEQGGAVWIPQLEQVLQNGWPADIAQSMIWASTIQDILSVEEKRIGSLAKKNAAEEVEKDALAARISSQLRLLRTDIIEFILSWYRDVLLCATGCPEDELHHALKAAILKTEAARLSEVGAQECLERLWDMQKKMERNVPVYAAALSCFRPTIDSIPQKRSI